MSDVILEFLRMTWPADWEVVFKRRASLVVEIGFGNGRFLLEMARKNPELNILGVEIATPSLNKTAERIHSVGFANVRLVRATAQSVLQTLCRPGTVDGATINFPDPWPKAGHTERRLISTPFLELLASRMAVGAYLDIATDHEEYGNWIASHLRYSPFFRSRLNQAYTHDDPQRLLTKYEKKGLAAGSKCFYFKWRRNSAAAPNNYPMVQELPMPHVILNIPLSLQEIGDRFEQRQCKGEDVIIRLIDLYQSQRRPSLIVDTYICEQPVAQRLMLEIYRRSDGDYLLRLLATGFPRATAGVHTALSCLANWLCSLHFEARVVRHNLRIPPITKGKS